MPFIKMYDEVEKEDKLKKETDFLKKGTIEDNSIRQIISKQKGKLDVESVYYKGNIAEGNWSILEDDPNIKKFDTEKIEEELIETCLKHGKSIREKDSEYTYVFIPSYYAVKKIILYYLRNTRQAKKIYGLRNAVVRRDSKKADKFYGGLPFVLKYMKIIYSKKSSKDDSIKYDFAELMQELIERKIGLEINNSYDEFINDIVDCINNSHCKTYILDKRIKEFKDAKDEYYCLNFKEELKFNNELLNYTLADDYTILMHRDVKKDWQHLKNNQIIKAKEKISKTPKHPYNDYPRDSEALKKDLKGWFSQRISDKDRLVYTIDKKIKTVYIATVCDHYKDASKRIKSKIAYK